VLWLWKYRLVIFVGKLKSMATISTEHKIKNDVASQTRSWMGDGEFHAVPVACLDHLVGVAVQAGGGAGTA
jgi:hypothetical protein